MSDRALALIFLNLGGEMLYVLDQRLYAQKIQVEKGNRIMQDIVTNMFSEKFLDEIFKPQELCSRKALRTIFERLAHTSIMRLNESSMDKLFDLMTMAVKYQTTSVTKPREILLVTLNHLDSIIPFVGDSSTCIQMIEQCYKRLFKTYYHMTNSELQMIRYTMLNFFQDLKIKVSVFLREKVQNWNGTFVLFHEGSVASGRDIPGNIIYYESSGDNVSVYKESKFNPGARYTQADDRFCSYERTGDRHIKLGLNVYSSSKPVDTIVSDIPSSSPSSKSGTKIISDYESMQPDPKAKAQLDLLCRLIGRSAMSSQSSGGNDIKLNLFNNEEEEFIYTTQVKTESTRSYDPNSKMVSFDASKRDRDERLNRLNREFASNEGRKPKGNSSSRHPNKYDDEDDDDDIVAMMDRMNRK